MTSAENRASQSRRKVEGSGGRAPERGLQPRCRMHVFACLLLLLASCKTVQTGPGSSGPDCRGSSEPTPGEMGIASFYWDQGIIGCLFGCGAEEPIAAGASGALQVEGWSAIGPFGVESETPEIATFEHEADLSYVIVRALAPGTAILVLTDPASGDPIERVRLDVEAVTTLLPGSATWQSRILLMEGGGMTIWIHELDEAGCPLVGIGAVEYDLEGGISKEEVTLVSAFADWIVSFLLGSIDEYVAVEADAIGEGTLTANAVGGASLELPFAVVDASAVATVTLQAAEAVAVGNDVAVSAVANDANGERVHSPACDWRFEPADAPVEGIAAGRESWSFRATEPTTITVSCTLGAATGSVEISVL